MDYSVLARELAPYLNPWQLASQPIYLPWTPEVAIPLPLASSGSITHRMPLPWTVQILALYASVFVNGTNNGTNYWTVTLATGSPAFTTIASFNTSGASGSTWTRFVGTISNQPVSTDEEMELSAVATGSPGSLYLVPAVAMLGTG